MVNHGWMFDGGVGMLFDDGLWMHLIWAIPLLLFIALLGYLVNKPRHNGGLESAPAKQTPLDVLKETYARGEISREEFLQKRDDLLEK
jgi:putative membrane protein